MQNLNITQVEQDGLQDCNHDWIYKNQTLVFTSDPPKYPFTRICKICGRIEHGTFYSTIEDNNYEDIYNKFYKNTINTVYNDSCSSCPNRPLNGEIKTCCCSLPYTNGLFKIT